jgi:hypothetical protein
MKGDKGKKSIHFLTRDVLKFLEEKGRKVNVSDQTLSVVIEITYTFSLFYIAIERALSLSYVSVSLSPPTGAADGCSIEL